MNETVEQALIRLGFLKEGEQIWDYIIFSPHSFDDPLVLKVIFWLSIPNEKYVEGSECPETCYPFKCGEKKTVTFQIKL